jgi:phosphoglycolate phosphatase
MRIKNIIFDWSGVISNDHKTVYETCMKVFCRLGVKEITYEEFRKEFELPYMNFNNKYHKAPVEEVEQTYRDESKTTGLPEMYPGAKEALQKFSSHGINMTLFTAMSSGRLAVEIKHFGIGHFFQNPGKDIRDKVREIGPFVKKHNFSPADTIYIGDMVHDIHAAKAAGLKVIAATWGYDGRQKLEIEKPDFVADSWQDVERIVFGE